MPNKFKRNPSQAKGDALASYYDAMGAQVTTQLLRLDALSYTESEASMIQGNIKVIVDRLNKNSFAWSYKVTPIIYNEAVSIARTSLKALGAVEDESYRKAKHKGSIENLAERTAKDMFKANRSINANIATYVHLLRQASAGLKQLQAFDLRDEEVIAGLLDDAILEGASRSKLNSLIRVHFKRKLYEQKFIRINDRDYNMISYAKMVSRTRLRKVQSEAMRNMCDQYQNDLVEVSAHGTTCWICKPYEGEIYSLNGNTPGYPILQPGDEPGWHPNCEHSIQPTSLEAINARTSH